MTIDQLEQNLIQAQRRVESIYTDGSSLEEIGAAYSAVSQAQRDLAAAQGLEYVQPLDFGIFPEAAVSGAMLFQDEYRAFLTFNAMRPEPDGRRAAAGLALVEIRGCRLTQFGHPNDEALPGHPLYDRGMEGYGIYEVIHSSWVEKHLQINRVHFPNYQWTGRHFMFTFHDSTFECIAADLFVEVEPFSPRFQKIEALLSAWDALGESA